MDKQDLPGVAKIMASKIGLNVKVPKMKDRKNKQHSTGSRTESGAPKE